MILLLLFTRNGPLLKFFLIPIQFQLDLFYFFINSKNSHLNIIQPFLMFDDGFIKFFNLTFESAALPFSHLPQMVLSFRFFIFGID